MVNKAKDAVARAEQRVRQSKELIERSLRLHDAIRAANRDMRLRITEMRRQMRKNESVECNA